MPSIQESNIRKDRLLPIMTALKQWVCWASHRHPRKDEKIPLDTENYINSRAEFQPSSYKNENIWMRYDEAKRKELSNDEIDGVGFVLENYNLCFIDLDNCLFQSSDGVLNIDPQVKDIVDDIGSYTEISTGGNGLHIICNGELASYGWSREESPIEISAFDGSWVAITGRHVKGTPRDVKNCPEDLVRLCEEYDFQTHGGW